MSVFIRSQDAALAREQHRKTRPCTRGPLARPTPSLLALAASFTRHNTQARVLEVLTDPHTGKALVIANQSRNMRSNTRRSVNSAVRAAYRSLAAFFIDLRPK